MNSPSNTKGAGHGSCGVSLDGRLGRAYDERTFRYFLEVERKRSERSRCPFLLLLVDQKEQQGASTRIDSVTASRVFTSLWGCVRETDLVGWYLEPRVPGAVLTGPGNGSLMEISRLIGRRVNDALGRRLPPDVARRLRVRIYGQPRLETFDSAVVPHCTLYPEGVRPSLFDRCASAVKRATVVLLGVAALFLGSLMWG